MEILFLNEDEGYTAYQILRLYARQKVVRFQIKTVKKNEFNIFLFIPLQI